MSSILAVWNINGEPVAAPVVYSMQEANGYPSDDGQGEWIRDSAALAHRHFWITPEDKAQPQPLVDPENGCVIACAARLDNREELIRALGRPANGGDLSDAGLILSAYRRWGSECPQRLLGDFAFVIWDSAGQRMFAARDALGCQELYYFYDRQHLMVASSISALLKHPLVVPTLNETKIAGYLACVRGDDVNTFYQSIYHVPPAHCLEVTPDAFRLRRYWDVESSRADRFGRMEKAAEQFRSLMLEAVRCRLRSAYPVGISISGGLDSSSLVVLAVEVLPESGISQSKLYSYSYVFDELTRCDERRYILPVIEKASSKFPVQQSMVLGDRLWPAPLNEDWQVHRDYPYQDAYDYLLRAVLQAGRRDGLRLMMSGFYGDDLYAGSMYWLADLLVERRFNQALRLFQRPGRPVDWKKDVVDHGLRALVPHAAKDLYRSVKPAAPAWAGFIHPALAARAGLDQRKEGRSARLVMHAPGWKKRYSSLFYSDYPESVTYLQHVARQCGMQYLFPFMDRRIVEFVLSIPSDMVGIPGITRRILREAMADSLPEVVSQRQDKTGLFDLFDKGVYGVGFSEIKNVLLHSQAVQRDFIQKEWVDHELVKDPPNRNSLALWNVLALETWLQRYW